MDKPYEFRQDNPRDQFTCLVGNLEGLALNGADGTVTDCQRLSEVILDSLERLKKLAPYFKETW